MRSLALALAAALALTGCLGGDAPTEATDVDAEPAGADPPAPVDPAGEAPAEPAATLTAMYLTADMGVSAAAPAEPAGVPIGETVNNPRGRDYPEWTGALPAGVPVTGVLEVRLFVTAPAGSMAANTLPVFGSTTGAGFPDFIMDLTVGNATVYAEAEGPSVMTPGEVYEVVASVPVDARAFDAGDPVVLRVTPTYVHVKSAAEFRILTGGEHASGIAFTN